MLFLVCSGCHLYCLSDLILCALFVLIFKEKLSPWLSHTALRPKSSTIYAVAHLNIETQHLRWSSAHRCVVPLLFDTFAHMVVLYSHIDNEWAPTNRLLGMSLHV